MNGFTDLRPNAIHERQNAEESFWPSFTDLMMVVVMIFLVTTSALYIRNWQLVQDMTAMIESERLARAVAQKTLAKQGSKDALLEQTNAKLLAAEQASQQIRLSLTEATESLRVLQMMRDALRNQKNRLSSELSTATATNQELTSQLSQEKARANTASAELNAAKAQLLAYQQAEEVSGNSLEAMKIDFDATTDRLVQLRADYAVLKSKYDKLLRPARSPKGKFVITLRHGKTNEGLYYDFRLPSDDAYTRVSEEDMHERLTQAVDEHGDDLYLKLVYPKNNSLSYEEALHFRNSVLEKYDYYYRDGQVEKIDE